ncbi:MAG: conserved membrane protein of unknown function [Promethearchaeota archaeon]|nr:MAG: conserved membrane protein of unknown function [Candidatus Lokiarchaeota archaeon]
MKKLEQDPKAYDAQFTQLTKGINKEVIKWILHKVNKGESVLEIGCGTGTLSAKIALKNTMVTAIDKNVQMINYAMKHYPKKEDIKLKYQVGSFRTSSIPEHSQDIVISKFMLSELGPFEQQIFLRTAWKLLKPHGRLIIAAEFIPSNFWKISFKLKRWWYNKKLKRNNIERTTPLTNFYEYIDVIGFEIIDEYYWNKGSIRAIELVKKNLNDNTNPGYYKPKPIKYWGIASSLKILRCVLTGQIDEVPIEPGIYRSGKPNETSPVLITANYAYTFIKVMRDLRGVDAWVVCINSKGINVWCAARGGDFGNKELIDAIEATGIDKHVDTNTLILPQLAAGGVSKPELPENSEVFPFKIKYGPIWSKDLKEYLELPSQKKSETMKRAKFSLSHRIRAGISHTTFLLRKIFLIPLIILSITLGVLDYTDVFNILWFVGYLVIWILFPNILLLLLYPLANFTRKFLIKGVIFGVINTILLGIITWVLKNSFLFMSLNLVFFFWIGFFTTMSFSGYTMATNPREIQNEYKIFKILNYILLIGSFSLSFLSIVYII